jgi:hypothetical protein
MGWIIAVLAGCGLGLVLVLLLSFRESMEELEKESEFADTHVFWPSGYNE